MPCPDPSLCTASGFSHATVLLGQNSLGLQTEQNIVRGYYAVLLVAMGARLLPNGVMITADTRRSSSNRLEDL